MVKLSKRLIALAKLVPAGMKVADIGTDHGFLPCYLAQEKITPFALGIDVNPGPCQAACRTVGAFCPGEAVEIRQGDGLKPLKPGEVDVVVIAGMGGATMKDILAGSPGVVSRLKKLILQPMNASEIIRTWLHANGWRIISEDLLAEDNRLYEVIAAEPGPGHSLSEVEACYGPQLIKNQHPLLPERLQKDERAVQEILTQLAKSNSEEAQIKIKEFNKKLEFLKELKEWLSAAKPS